MKWFLIIIDIFLVAVVCIAARYHYSFKDPKPDKALNSTPKLMKKVKNIPAAIKNDPINIEEIVGNNPFHPQRGQKENKSPSPPEEPQTPPPRNQPKFDLVGICKLGDTAGAIIIPKGVVRRTHRSVGRRRHASRSRSTDHYSHQNKQHFFKLNDEVSDGYKLVTVTQTSATLQSSSGKIELKIEHTRFDQESKTAQSTKASSNRNNHSPKRNTRTNRTNRKTVSSRGK